MIGRKLDLTSAFVGATTSYGFTGTPYFTPIKGSCDLGNGKADLTQSREGRELSKYKTGLRDFGRFTPP